MPELAEVEITRRKLLALMRGRRILDFGTDWVRGLRTVNNQGPMAHSIAGRKILEVKRRGKVLFFELSGRPPRMLAVHLGMSGRLEVARSAVAESDFPREVRLRPARWVHFRWRLSGGRELQLIDPRKFGAVWYGAPKDLGRDPYLSRLGQEANIVTFRQFYQILSSVRGMIKPFLLRQDKLAGIGNIIADESLWRARIHPETPITYLDSGQRRRLYHEIRRTIQTMLASGGTSIRNWTSPDGTRGRFQERRLVYGKAGSPCPRCRKALKRIAVGGRGTSICPHCQKLRGLLPGVKR